MPTGGAVVVPLKEHEVAIRAGLEWQPAFLGIGVVGGVLLEHTAKDARNSARRLCGHVVVLVVGVGATWPSTRRNLMVKHALL